MRNAYKSLVRKAEGKGSLGNYCHTWKDNIRMDLKETGWEVVDWMLLDQDKDQWLAVVNTIMNVRVP
jgi:hypothetical protein